MINLMYNEREIFIQGRPINSNSGKPMTTDGSSGPSHSGPPTKGSTSGGLTNAGKSTSVEGQPKGK